MMPRRLHPALPDYGIVEIGTEDSQPEFVVYYEGAELCRCNSLEQAADEVEAHRSGATHRPAASQQLSFLARLH